MRTGSDQYSRGRYRGIRPFQEPRTLQPNQIFDSNGTGEKIRGSAQRIFERYIGLARAAAVGGDRIAAENCYQYADHYYRIANAGREGNQQATASSPATPADASTGETQQKFSETDLEGLQLGSRDDRPGLI